jgi:hypothetical protein
MLKNDKAGAIHFAVKSGPSTHSHHVEVKTPNERLREMEAGHCFLGLNSNNQAC